jgi:hypothetical protein
MTICLSANTLYYPNGGGHLWVHLNWALGLKANGYSVIWLEKVEVNEKNTVQNLQECINALKNRLAPFGFDNCLALYSSSDEQLPQDITQQCLDIEAASEADLLINLRYDLPDHVVGRFSRSAMLDIDPGLLQFFLANGTMKLAQHHVYFTIGETVGQPGARFPSAGLKWHYTAPCVDIDWWKPKPAPATAPFTTLSHWNTNQWVVEEDGSYYSNDKRDGFLPFLDIPQKTAHKLELALCLGGDIVEQEALLQRGWHVREASEVSYTPEAYQEYIQQSRGEFSCVKPHCVRLQNAWISDRTICYLASGKPAVVQHTGPSRFLPGDAGLFRFHDMDGAVRCLEQVAKDYDKHSALARALAEEYFDARKITAHLLERAL